MKLPITLIEARDIPDAWFQCISKVQEVGFKYEIQQGSFVGQTRLEFDQITVQIEHPYSEPYSTMLPDIPAHLGIPNPVASGYIEQYLPYLMTDHKEATEDYTYGQRLFGFLYLTTFLPMQPKLFQKELFELLYDLLYKAYIPATSVILDRIEGNEIDQVDHFIRLLKETPNTNQAILQIAQPQDCLLSDPPCLHHIDIRVKSIYIEPLDHYEYYLVFYPYFRSWDLWSGFPANLAAIAVLQKYMADEIGIDTGPIIATSKGLHLYSYVEELAKLRVGR